MLTTPRRRQRGIGAVVIIALIAMAAVLAGAALMLSSAQQTAIAADLQGARAYQAARSGLEWGIHHVLRAGAPDCADMAGGTTFSLTGALDGVHVTVTCTQSNHEDPSPVSVYSITATGCTALAGGRCDPSATPATVSYAERQLRALIGSD
jgi:MSHA biogenesis protein MshP